MPTRTWRGTTDSNWGTSTNWLEGAVPTAADDVVFDATSPACTVNASNRACLTINFTNYINTITMTFGINVSGNITLGSGMGVGGAGFLAFNNVSATYTSNGFTWPNEFRFISSGTSKTYTLASNCSFSGAVNNVGSGFLVTTFITGGFTISCSGTLSVTGTQQLFGGSGTGVTFKMTNGTLGGASGFGLGGASANIIIDSGANTVTISGVIQFTGSASTFTYTSGVVNALGGTLGIGNSVTLNFGSGVKWGVISVNAAYGSGTIGLSNDLWCNSLDVTQSLLSAGVDRNIYLNTYSGDRDVTAPFSQSLIGLIFNGGSSNASSGTISHTGNNAWRIIEIDMPLVTITSSTFVLGGLNHALGMFKITSGTIVPPTTLSIIKGSAARNFSITAPGIVWNNVSMGIAGGVFNTFTMTEDLIVSRSLTLTGTTATSINGFNIWVNAGLIISNTVGAVGGAIINLVGTGTWVHTTGSMTFSQPVVIDTGGTITISGTVYKSGNLRYTRGKIRLINSNFIIPTTSSGWVNMHRIALDTVTITGGTTQTMNEFFRGRPGKFCVVRSSNTTNVSITFTNGFEKFARWVLPSNMTITQRGQVKLLSSKGNRNSTNLGFTYFEGGTPYTFPKNNPIVYQGLPCFGIGDNPADPNFF